MDAPILWDIVDFLYKSEVQYLPQFFQDRPMLTAPLLGFIHAYPISRGFQYLTDRVISDPEDRFGQLQKWMKRGIQAAVLAYVIIDPSAKELVMEHPVYTAGMASGILGGFVAIDCHLRRSVRREELLEERMVDSASRYTPTGSSVDGRINSIQD
jgi:hypothetical protein